MENKIKSLEHLTSKLNEILDAEAYAASTRKEKEFILNSLSAYMKNLNQTEYTAEIGKQFVEYFRSVLKVCSARVSGAKNITERLNRISEGKTGRDVLLRSKRITINLPRTLQQSLDEYIRYCNEIGNKQSTIHYKRWIVGKFLECVNDSGCSAIEAIDGQTVQIAFLSIGGYMRYWKKLCQYFHFLYEQGYTKHNFSKLIQIGVIPQPQPTVYSVDEIQALEQSFDLSTRSGVRNYAITLLMSRYGIRACDVAALTFENIDFTKNRIKFIQQKTGELWECILFPVVKDAIENYVQNIRPKFADCNSIFITETRPYTAIRGGTINTMINSQFRKANITIAEKRHGSRVLRSSLASNMVNDGISTEIVRNVLGHSSSYAIRHYARIDVESMRICTLPVSMPSGLFFELLSGGEARYDV